MNRPRPRLSLLCALVLSVPILAAIPGGHLMLAILGISFLIFIHEWGHFAACRLMGVRTETFSIGFGPRLFGWEKDKDGRTRFTTGRRQLDPALHAMDFRVALIPLGGYVKMAGELPGEGGRATGEPATDEFPAKSASARTFIVSAGVIMNFLTAIVFYGLSMGSGMAYESPIVGEVSPGDGAWVAGVQTGDRLVQVDGEPIDTFLDFMMETAFVGDAEARPYVVERAGETMTLPVRPIYNEEWGIPAVGIRRGSRLSLGAGDHQVSIGPTDVVEVAGIRARGGTETWRRVVEAFSHGHDPVEITLADGARHEVRRPAAQTDPAATPIMIGISPYGPPEVRAARGAAQGLLSGGDRIVAVEVAGERRSVDSEATWRALPYGPPVTAIWILHRDEELRRDVTLATPQEIASFLEDVALISPRDARLSPLPAGYIAQDPRAAGPGVLLRYPRSPALEAGLMPGDRVVRVAGQGVDTWSDIQREVRGAKADEPISLTVRNAKDEERQVDVRPVALERLVLEAELAPATERFATDGVLGAAGAGLTRTWRETRNVFRTIGALFTGKINFNKNIAGPITLIDASKRKAEGSFADLIWFLAYVSVMLAVLNILPIPVLDGGHLLFILIEKIKGRPLRDETIYNFQKVGFLMLLVLMFFAFKNDITRLLP